MKKIALAAVLATAGTTAFAGNIEPVAVEPVVLIEEDTSSSSAGIVVPVLALLLIAAAVAN